MLRLIINFTMPMGYHKLYSNAWLEHFLVWLRCEWQSPDHYFFSEDFRDNVNEAPPLPPFSLSIWKCVFCTLLASSITLENKLLIWFLTLEKMRSEKLFCCVPIHSVWCYWGQRSNIIYLFITTIFIQGSPIS